MNLFAIELTAITSQWGKLHLVKTQTAVIMSLLQACKQLRLETLSVCPWLTHFLKVTFVHWPSGADRAVINAKLMLILAAWLSAAESE